MNTNGGSLPHLGAVRKQSQPFLKSRQLLWRLPRRVWEEATPARPLGFCSNIQDQGESAPSVPALV